MLRKCCLCIDLRAGTLILASLGIVSHLYSAVLSSSLPLSGTDSDSFMTLFSTLSYIAAIASLAGFVGVFQRSPRLVKIFSAYAFAELALSFFFAIFISVMAFSVRNDVCEEILVQPEMDPELNMSTCLQYYDGVATAIIAAIGAGLLLRLHFALAIRAYYVTLRDNRAQYFSYPVVYTIVPGAVVDQDLEESLEGPPAYEETSKLGLGSSDIKL